MAEDGINDVNCDDVLAGVLEELTALRAGIVAETRDAQHCIDAAHPRHRASARNLLHYLALRRRDLRPLQQRLSLLGLSSLGRAEAHVLATLDAVLALLRRVTGKPPAVDEPGGTDAATGMRLLNEHADVLLGPRAGERSVRIMVTMPSEAADDASLVHELLKQGMDCIRINCAHDDTAVWLRMIENLRRAEQALGRRCKVAMDLAGPKLRTGPLAPGPQVVRIRPKRDVYGRVLAPGRIWVSSSTGGRPVLPANVVCLVLPDKWVARLRKGDRVTLRDARDAKRTMTVAETAPSGCWLETDKTAYIVPKTILRHQSSNRKGKRSAVRVGTVPPTENAIRLQRGDLLVLTRELVPGCDAVVDATGHVLEPARIGCTLPDVFDDVRPGEPVWFDDGKIGGVVEYLAGNDMRIRITRAPDRGAKLRADKGINFPDSDLHCPALTGKDIVDLAFAARHADIVELSFANEASDVEALQARLAGLGERQPAIVLKVETRRGFEHLPAMLLAAMRSSCCGVMIARGDLAVESGFERLAEVQEEMLWICEAAHVPVIWATQVLETLTKNGQPSRAEITDAAMGDRAECVMLNKGPHIVEAVITLDDILKRMQTHQAKKQSMLRKLRLADARPAGPLDGVTNAMQNAS
jgi:pyruvate kinase